MTHFEQPVVQAGGVPTENCHRASVPSKLLISTFDSWKSWHTSVLRCQIHSIEFGLVGQIPGCACFIFTHSKCHHGLRSKLLAKTMMLLFRQNRLCSCDQSCSFGAGRLGSPCLPMRGLRAEDSQRLKVESCGFTDVAVHGICRNPEPRGVTNMPWATLRCGVLDEDWGKHAWDNLLSICCHLQLDFPSWCCSDFSSLDWSRFATTNEQVASLWFVLTHSQSIAPLCEENALQFTPHLSPVLPHICGINLWFLRFCALCFLAIGQKAAPCQKGMIQVSVVSS